jgi:pimeloyl-ACP methyl ester carboxylesterase
MAPLDPILDHPLVSARYFFPRRCHLDDPVLVEAGDARLACAAFRPHPGGPTLLHFHGNGEVVADWLEGFPELVASMGANLFLAEYRGYGMSTGTPQLGRMLEDVARVVEGCGAPPERLVPFGRSVGSIFAIEAAARWPVAGLVLESGVADPRERLRLRLDPRELGLSEEEFAAPFARRLDHRAKLARHRGPALVLHAADDDLVPPDNARRLAAWTAGPAELCLLPRGGHNAILSENLEAYAGALADFLARLP